jgi:hypothetical protein
MGIGPRGLASCGGWDVRVAGARTGATVDRDLASLEELDETEEVEAEEPGLAMTFGGDGAFRSISALPCNVGTAGEAFEG